MMKDLPVLSSPMSSSFFFINFVSKFGENNEKSPCFFVWIRFDDIVDLVVTSLDDAIW